MIEKTSTEGEKNIEAVSAQGSIGLLALGYRGVLAWREKRTAENPHWRNEISLRLKAMQQAQQKEEDEQKNR